MGMLCIAQKEVPGPHRVKGQDAVHAGGREHDLVKQRDAAAHQARVAALACKQKHLVL
jgi:hypothetical protein